MVDLVFDPDKLVTTPLPPLPAAGERMYMLHESIFGRIGPALVRNGWSVFPQEREEGRKSAVVDGRALKWKPYQGRLPSPSEIRSWSLQCPGENVAIITGPVSGNLFALDVDVDDPDLAATVRQVATEHLGHTPFYRFGRVPRVIMLYRHEDGVAMRKRSYRFGRYGADGTWGPSGEAIEFLANGSPFTAFGIHYKTGQYFKWGDEQPFLRNPSDVPVATADQIASFLTAVQDVRRFHRASSAAASTGGVDVDLDRPIEFNVLDYGVVPAPNMQGQWVWEGDQVTDGRHFYLLEYVRQIVCANEAAFDAGCEDHTSRVKLMQFAAQHVRDHCADADDHGKRSRQALTTEVTGLFRSTIEKFNERGEGGRRLLAPIRTFARADGRRVAPVNLTTTFARDAALNFLGERSSAAGLVAKAENPDAKGPRVRALGVDAPTPEKEAARRLGGDRTAMQERVQANTRSAGAAWREDVSKVPPAPEGDESRGPMPPWRIHLDGGPTGAGKTTTNVSAIADMILDEKRAGIPYRGMIVITPPSHANIAEAAVVGSGAGMRFHDAQDDQEGIEDYDQMGLQELADHAVSLGIRAVHLKSKVLAGCHKVDRLKILQDAGLSTRGICRARVLDAYGESIYDEHGDVVEQFCEHYERATCGHRQQILALDGADVVFAAHAHLTGPIPEALKRARGLVIDESVVHQILATGQVAVSTLLGPRPWPSLNAAEAKVLKETHGTIDDGVRAAHLSDLMEQRARAARLAERVHKDRSDIVLAFADVKDALTWANTARRICTSAMAMGKRVTPRMTVDGVQQIVARAKPHEVEIEHRFWDVVIEAVEGLHERRKKGIFRTRASDALPVDTRLQAVTDLTSKGEIRSWRVSWRRSRNWLGLPTLMLDATGDAEITRLLNRGAEVIEYRPLDVSPNLRVVLVTDRTYSPSMLYPSDKADLKRRKAADIILQQVRQLTSQVAGAHGGQMLWTGPLATRRRFFRQWSGPKNIVPAHLGALRGQDWAKSFPVSLCIGRSEQSIRVVDGLVAALTWDSKPEHPYDRLGNGRTADGKPLFRPLLERVVRVRTGHDVRLAVPQMPTEWGRRIEAMWRESELLQFVGRLRGIYRVEPGTVILCCDCPPEGLIVDDVLTMKEALGDHSRDWEIAGEMHGLMVEGVTSRSTMIDEGSVERFVRRYRDWPAMRQLTWTDHSGVDREGLVPVWQTDVEGALRSIGAPQRCLDTLRIATPLMEQVPMVAREPDHVSLDTAQAWEPELRESHYRVWSVSNPPEDGVTPRLHELRFGLDYDPADYPALPTPEDEALPLDDAPDDDSDDTLSGLFLCSTSSTTSTRPGSTRPPTPT